MDDIKVEAAEVATPKKAFKSLSWNNTPPAFVVESQLADALKEMMHSLNSVNEDTSEKLSKVEQFKAMLAIWAVEVHNCHDSLSKVKPSTLNSKHRAFQKLLPLMLMRLELLMAYTKDCNQETDGHVVAALKEALMLIGVFHTVLHKDTTAKARTNLVVEFEEEYAHVTENA
jgi:hypothetical protein